MDFDPVDRQILDILRQDGRASHASIAKQVGLSAPAVGKRVAKLEQDGVILGYRAVLDNGAIGLPIGAFVMITPQPRKPAQRLVERLLELPEVEALYAVAGEYSFIAMVRSPSPADLDGLLDRIFMLDGVEATRTAMVLRTAAERVTFLPPERVAEQGTDRSGPPRNGTPRKSTSTGGTPRRGTPRSGTPRRGA